MSKVLEAIPEITYHRKSIIYFKRLINKWLISIERSPVTAFFALTLLYLLVVVLMSSLKLLWFDELITLHIARLGSVAAICHSLALGADPNPPVTHILVHFCRVWFGEHELALRLPSIVGYWLGLACLFCYLKRRVPPVWAITGVLMSMCMASFEYSFESRSYGLFYGMAIAAFLCWSLTKDPNFGTRVKQVTLLGMFTALAVGVTTNYFAVLNFIPIAAGEIAFSWQHLSRRSRTETSNTRVQYKLAWKVSDVRIWITLLLAASPMLLFCKMIVFSIAQFAPYAWNKVSLSQAFGSYTEMVEVMLYPIVALLALALLIRSLIYVCRNCRGSLHPLWLASIVHHFQNGRPRLPFHEVVAIICLTVYPILGYVVASLYGGMLSARFVMPVCFGFAIAGSVTAFRLFGHLRPAGAAFLCFSLAWFVARESVVGYMYMNQKESFYNILSQLEKVSTEVPAGAPIAVPDPLMALTFQHYAPGKYTSRIVFPVDFAAVRTYRGDDSPEENLWAGRGSLYTLPIIPLTSFQHDSGKYLVLASDHNWLIEDLRHHRYPVTRLNINTVADAIGGFTPLSHGPPVFFISAGDLDFRGMILYKSVPEPFSISSNLPTEILPDRQ